VSGPTIGIALSGGGARAMAFHLGCLRALHDRGILEKATVLSAVSGGAVIGALYAYSDDSFETFEKRVEDALSKGMFWGIMRHTLFSPEAIRIVAAILLAGVVAIVGRIIQVTGLLLELVKVGTPLRQLARCILDLLPRFASRTTGFERHLAKTYFGDTTMDQVGRKGLTVVINGTELRTEAAFRFGSLESGNWRFGRMVDRARVATAVAVSAAFPVFLPSIDRRLQFEKNGVRMKHRVILTDGGVHDNFGITCMLPGRLNEFSTNALPMEFIIACDAGEHMPAGAARPYFWGTRMMATLTTIHRRTQTMSQNLLHRLNASGELQGFIMPYLGQNDANLPFLCGDFITRDETFDYPTDFFPMSKANVCKLSARGEQLTNVLVEAYAGHL
jgi:NTE family protein